MYLRLPARTDIRDAKSPFGGDWCECPSGSSRVYRVVFVDDIGGGFANEHRLAILETSTFWPVPFPSPSGPFPPAPPGPPVQVGFFQSGHPNVTTFNVPITMPYAGNAIALVQFVNNANAPNTPLSPTTLTSAFFTGATVVGGIATYLITGLPSGASVWTQSFPGATTGRVTVFVIALKAGSFLYEIRNAGAGTLISPSISESGIPTGSPRTHIAFSAAFDVPTSMSPSSPFHSLTNGFWLVSGQQIQMNVCYYVDVFGLAQSVTWSPPTTTEYVANIGAIDS